MGGWHSGSITMNIIDKWWSEARKWLERMTTISTVWRIRWWLTSAESSFFYHLTFDGTYHRISPRLSQLLWVASLQSTHLPRANISELPWYLSAVENHQDNRMWIQENKHDWSYADVFSMISIQIRSFSMWSSVQVIASKRPDQVNLGGDRQKTPLHYAALSDNLGAAQILVRVFRSAFFHWKQIFIDPRRITMLVYTSEARSVVTQSMWRHWTAAIGSSTIYLKLVKSRSLHRLMTRLEFSENRSSGHEDTAEHLWLRRSSTTPLFSHRYVQPSHETTKTISLSLACNHHRW